ncbi:MAG: serine/threonine-protein phosphatase, partial [candidate division Zixibacteria bacterium]|nr:serine/threonine-protein phosphatase [candidate division Zixibacteria bacterium]
NIKKGMFVTMFYGVLDKETGHFTFASAGHNPLIRLKGDGGEPELIKTRGYPLGMMPSAQFDRRIESGELTLAPDDWLVQYTDGVNEAQNPAGEEFGMGRLVDMLVFNRDLEPEEFVRDSVGKHTAFVDTAPQFDDITLVTMKWMAGVPITTMTDY